MNKGVANFFRYEEVARAANLRYLDALSVVHDPTPTTRAVTNLTESRQVAHRRYAGFNPAKREHAQLFAAVLRGEHLLHGFHNADIRRILCGESRDPALRRRQSHAIGRQLKRLHVRGLLARIPRTRRWKVTNLGRSLLSQLVHLYHADLALAA